METLLVEKKQEKELALKEMADFKINMMTEGFSNATIDTYLKSLGKFRLYLKEKSVERLTEVTPEIVNQYRIFISLERPGRGRLSLQTQNLMMIPILNFFRFLVREKHFLYDPTSHIRLAKPVRKRVREVLSEREMIRLLNAPNPEKKLGLRDKALLELYYSCGIRNTESRLLTVKDVDLENRTVRVRFPKGGGDEVVPIGRVAALYLEEYMRDARPKLLRNDLEETLFLSFTGKPLGDGDPSHIVHKYTKKAKIKRNACAHSLRHTCATHLYDNGADVRSIQLLLRHKSLETTQIYLEVKASKLRKVLEKTHPRERGMVYAPPIE